MGNEFDNIELHKIYPDVIVWTQAEICTGDSLNAQLDHITQILNQRENFILITDGRNLKQRPTVEDNLAIKNFLKNSINLKHVIFIDSKFNKLIKYFLRFQFDKKIPIPYTLVKNSEEAFREVEKIIPEKIS
ncbi:MAG: hypothetical protein OEZ01_01885 [Candidatus Heimdallarchaeota archaeon]|nr:hypothetical protein [Candidatus Heimdallarchaeota archaeon]MDH5644724.1 hypothetical protein [Candidatus Heimdallarchaeota archaeon]